MHAERVQDYTNFTHSVVVAVGNTGIAEQEIDVVTNIAEGYDFISDPTLILSRSNRLKDMFPSGWAMPEHSSTLSTERKIRL